jgi:asparagine synthase (glutamine-hydrolysing)
MCGICGQYNYSDTGKPVSDPLLRTMTGSIAHRGPDDEGYYLSGPIGLGFRRLSIIDLSGGHQPMSDAEGTVWVVFNGEIYNFAELRSELESRGFLFKTNSDTEVIVHGYRMWGLDVLHRLNGMFGLAIWDQKLKRLLLARDRMGIKPVYFTIRDGCLYFGSEIRCLLPCFPGKPEIDPLALSLFLRYRYTPSPYTIIKGIKKLGAGTRLIAENGTLTEDRWWKFSPTPLDPLPTEDESEEELLDIYRRSVRRHLISDVPVGLLLSAGLDSGLLLGLMNQYGTGWETFTIGFNQDFREDEITAAEEIAKGAGSPNYAIRMSKEDFDSSLSRVVSVLEEPIATSSIIPMYRLCELARSHVKVALMGQGPDECFGGYPRHLGVRYGAYWRDVPHSLRSIIGRAGRAVFPRNETLARALYSLDVPGRMERYERVFSIISDPVAEHLFLDETLPKKGTYAVLNTWNDMEPLMRNLDELGGFQFLEVRSSLPDELLMYADKLSMIHGLEIRVPYLDLEIVEYVERLPAHYKIRYGNQKWLHRRICQRFSGNRSLQKKKIGFATPVDEWFREACNSMMDDRLLCRQSHIYEFVRFQSVEELMHQHRSGQADNNKILFSLTMLEELLRAYLN